MTSTGPAANVKLEYCESYETVSGLAGCRLGSRGNVAEPVPKYSYDIPSTVTTCGESQKPVECLSYSATQVPQRPGQSPTIWMTEPGNVEDKGRVTYTFPTERSAWPEAASILVKNVSKQDLLTRR